MADPREDRIDFNKLERELEAAVESDERYWRENDAKMRAVEQRVETYEQFRWVQPPWGCKDIYLSIFLKEEQLYSTLLQE